MRQEAEEASNKKEAEE
jgi:rRNA maturation endonuclease Nob1